MKKVLILNHQYVKCGVYQIGERIYNIISNSKKIDFQYRIVSNWNDYRNFLLEVNPDFIIYNYHWDRMPWLKDDDIIGNTKVKHYFIYHDGSMMRVYDKYLFFGALDPDEKDVPKEKRVLLPRPLYEYKGDYRVNSEVNIGSFGFAFNHKNFHLLAPYVGNQFHTATVNLHFTNPYFGDTPGNKISNIIKLCEKYCPGHVKLNITTNFMDDNKVMEFLSGNDLNVFLYDTSLQNPGISSAIDYALSVKRPIAVSNNMMFRHIISNDILVEMNRLSAILEKGVAPLQRFYSEWSPEKLKEEMENLFI